jgi:HSP20 family molecular chaperone IbpA
LGSPWHRFPLEKAEREAFVPALDMIETPKEYVVRCEVPGIHSKNLDISLTGSVPKITGLREEAQEGAGDVPVEGAGDRYVRADSQAADRSGGGQRSKRPIGTRS